MTRVYIPREPIDPGKIVRNPKVAAEWKAMFRICWLCIDPKIAYDVHHIVGGAHRTDEPCNFALFCRRCHMFVESMEPLSGVRLCMHLKQIYDPDNYDKSRIEALFGRRLDQ